MKKYWPLLLIVVLIAIGIIIINWPRWQLKVINPGVGEIEKVAKTEYKFSVLADVHNDSNKLERALIMAKEAENDLVIVAGDLTINGTKKELEKIKKTLDESKINYLVVPGNHDLWQGIVKTTEDYDLLFGKKYQSVDIPNGKLILINNGSRRGLGDDQKLWIQNEVQSCIVVKCVAIMHMPLDHTLTKHVMGEGSEKVTEEAGWLQKILVENQVETIYAGHLHYADSYTIDGLTTNLVGAISEKRNNQSPRMTEVVFDGSDYVSRVVEVE